MLSKVFNHWSVLPVSVVGLVGLTVLRGIGVALPPPIGTPLKVFALTYFPDKSRLIIIVGTIV